MKKSGRFLINLTHPLNLDEKIQVSRDIAKSATSSFDFFLLVVLSCSIATLGLITNSPAVIIGAMLVAPLMSPIIGVGLASIEGNARLARNSATALLLGAVLAVLLSAIMTLVNSRLPFVTLQELPAEVLARTHPSPIDLVIALAGGLAASYALTRSSISAALPGVSIATALMPPLCTVGIGLALSRWDVAGGASLLFLTNAITIAFAAALVFFLRGFAPKTSFINHKIPGTLVISAIITFFLLVPLSYYSVQFFKQANENRLINQVVAMNVNLINVELVDFQTSYSANGLDMVITIRTTAPLRYDQVVTLQKGIVTGLQQPVSLKVNQIFAEQLDPLIPPTATRTQTPIPSNTLGPSPTVTPTALPPTASPTVTPSQTIPPTNSPTPALVLVQGSSLPRMQIYQTPGGPIIGQVRPGQQLFLLYGKVDAGGITWVEVRDQEGRVGWLPEIYLLQITLTPGK